MKRATTMRRFAKGAGTVLLWLVAIDLAATIVMLAFGWRMFRG